jgi:hypothetical protein
MLRRAGSGRWGHLRAGGLWPSARVFGDRSGLLRLASDPERPRSGATGAASPSASSAFVGCAVKRRVGRATLGPSGFQALPPHPAAFPHSTTRAEFPLRIRRWLTQAERSREPVADLRVRLGELAQLRPDRADLLRDAGAASRAWIAATSAAIRSSSLMCTPDRSRPPSPHLAAPPRALGAPRLPSRMCGCPLGAAAVDPRSTVATLSSYLRPGRTG